MQECAKCDMDTLTQILSDSTIGAIPTKKKKPTCPKTALNPDIIQAMKNSRAAHGRFKAATDPTERAQAECNRRAAKKMLRSHIRTQNALNRRQLHDELTDKCINKDDLFFKLVARQRSSTK